VRVLLDVNILVRSHEHAFGSARTLLLTLIEQKHTILISGDMLIELAEVLRYPRLRKLYGITEEQIYDYVQLLREVCETVIPNRSLRVPIRDVKDISVLQTAVLGEADVICTLDSGFYDSETKEFCSSAGISILSDTELLARITDR
jgi:putative PIN family toxin of toxin-antitoxin system